MSTWESREIEYKGHIIRPICTQAQDGRWIGENTMIRFPVAGSVKFTSCAPSKELRFDTKREAEQMLLALAASHIDNGIRWTS